MTPDLIRCRRCGADKPPDAFHVHKRKKNGRASYCKGCIADYGRQLRRARGEGPARRRVRIRPGWIRCSKCGRDLPESEFRKDGAGRPYSWCRIDQNAYLAELNRSKRKDPSYREVLRQGDRRRRAAVKRENRAERETRLHRAQLLIERLTKDGWSLQRLAAASGIARSTLGHIRAGHVPFPETYRRLVRFEREVRA